MRKLLIILALLFLEETIAGQVYASVVPVIQWSATRHSSLTPSEYNQTIFDETIQQANMLVNYLDLECYLNIIDIACALKFERSVSLSSFANAGLDIITNDLELQQAYAIGGYRFKVVRDVRFCNGYDDPEATACAPVNSDTVVIEYIETADTYLHEYVHNESTGETHRNDCSYDIMNLYGLSDDLQNTLNQSECELMGGRLYNYKSGDVYDTLLMNGMTDFLSYDPYYVQGNITVPVGKTLTVNAGVEVQVGHGMSFRSTGGGPVYFRPGGTGDPVYVYSNCSNIHPCP